MKEYIIKFTTKLNETINKYPNAELRYNSGSLNSRCGCKCLDCDIVYVEKDNTIYIG